MLSVMPRRGGQAHVATIKTKGKGGKEYTSYLLRRSYREGGKVRHENLGNLSHLPLAVIEAIRKMLAGRVLVDLDEQLQIESSRPHGHVAAVLGVLRSLDLERLLARERCPERDLAVAMICQLVIAPCSKLSMTRRFSQTTLADELSLGEVTEPELLAAMDWLLDRQERIENALARRHLPDGGFVLYDLSSSYVEGRCCPLAALGHSRDGKPGKLQVNWGLVCSPEGRPVAVQVHPGNTADPTTVPDVIDTVKERFGIERVILVGDRAMITDAHAATLKELGAGFVSALKSAQIRKLIKAGRSAAVAVRSDQPGRDHLTPSSPASGSWCAATRISRRASAESARTCCKRPSASWTRSQHRSPTPAGACTKLTPARSGSASAA